MRVRPGLAAQEPIGLPIFAAMAHEATCAPIVVAGPAVEAVRARPAKRADVIEVAARPARGWLDRLGLRCTG